MINIAVIGAGQLGSRHLQALALLKQEVNIQVIDSSDDSLRTAEQRFKEVNSSFKGTVSFHKELNDLEKNIQVAIIATNSKVRMTVLRNLIAHAKIKYIILEKFLFVKKSDYLEAQKLLEENHVSAWVNCARRMIPFYQHLKKELKGSILFSAVGNNWGLGCNGIHLLDLFAFLSDSKDIILSNDLLDKNIQESKRSGYIEFTGTITGHTDKHSLHLSSFASDTSPLHITVNTATARYSIQEGATSKVWISRLDKNWEWEEVTFNIPFQSQLTHILVNDLLEKGNCDLPSFRESSHLHLLLLENFTSFLQKINNDNSIEECLIT